MKKHLTKRLLSLVVVLALCLGLMAVPGFAASESNGLIVEKVDNSAVSATLKNLREVGEIAQNTPSYGEHDTVRVSIVLGGKSTLELSQEKGISLKNYAETPTLTDYRANLLKDQQALAARISTEVLNGKELDVVWNLTLAANIISAYVEYGQIEAIKGVKGVKDVVLECQYEPAVVSKGEADPNMATSPVQTGSSIAHLAGYTGAGSRIAIIDTGTDLNHQSFNNAAFLYALAENAEKAGMEYDEYIASLDLLDAEEIESVLGELNVSRYTAAQLYNSEKHPFTFSYVDGDLDVSHYNSEHGSHVAGISTANRYLSDGEGGFVSAMESVMTQGVAPDAQLLTMQVFGNAGGAYDSDYMVAIEDAIVLKADAVNLSLGSGNPGMTTSDTYQDILDSLAESDTVVVMSAGNSGYWVESSTNGVPYLFSDDVSFHTGGSPGTFTNSLGVASVENAGYTTLCVKVDGTSITYAESLTGNDGVSYGNAAMTTIGGEQEYVFLNGIGTVEQFEAIADVVAGKVALCYRGETSFFEKANAAVAAGAIGVIIVNNTPNEIIYLNLTGYEYTAPVVSVTMNDGEHFKTGTPVTVGDVQYWTGTMEIGTAPEVGYYDSEYYTMSSFSSWGVPGDLSMKPEITAPGGNIYSVFGTIASSGLGGIDQYELMSGTSMAAPQITGMMALLMQYIRENDLSVDGLTDRALAQSLLMSTAVPMRDGESGGNYYPVLQQGSGLANIGAAVLANSYILMGEDATDSWADGKVKVELGDDPAKTGSYEFTFSINNLTDEALNYTLSANFFTQDLFPYAGYDFLDTWTTPVDADVTWLADGEITTLNPNLDFDGNGLVNDDDGQALLDYATGARSDLYNIEYADIDLDGAVDSHDAYAFLSGMYGSAVVVPANGSVEVTVQIQLDTAKLDQYPNGAYVEGYVYVDCMSTEEGVAGESHSIPVLGFYGNWTDPSMFEVGSLKEYMYGLEDRPGYLYGLNGIETNFMTIKYAGDPTEYLFGGNPMVADEVYLPERDALSSLTGDALNKLYFTSIRNAGNSMLLVTDAETGEVYMAEELGPISSAYYYVNGGVWQNTQMSLKVGGWNGEGIPNNTIVNVSLVAAPELYANEDGSYRWDELGDGAYLTTTLTIDNTAPVIDEESVTIDTENNLLTLLASDNQYVAGVALFDVYGQYLYTYTGAYAEANPGDVLEYALDLAEVGGPSFLLQVYDYAMNATTYKITQQIGEVVDEVAGVLISETSLALIKGNTFQLEAMVQPVNTANRDIIWESLYEDVATVDENGLITAVDAGATLITATSAADETKFAYCIVEVISLDYTVNGVLQDEDGAPMSFTWNLAEDNTWSKVADIEPYIGSAAAASDGDVYIMDSSSMATYKINPVTGQTVAAGAVSPIPYWDMATSTVFGAVGGGDLAHGIYAGYLFPMEDPLALDDYGYNLGSALAQYTGGSYLMAVASAGLYYDTQDRCYAELIYALDNAGYIWLFEYTQNGDFYLFNFYPTNLDLEYQLGDFVYCSLVEADDGSAMFLSHFNGSTNDIYMLAPYADNDGYIAGFDAILVGNVGEDVWPAALTSVTTNSTNAPSNNLTNMVTAREELHTMDIQKTEVSFAQPAAGGLNSVNTTSGNNNAADIRPMSQTEIDVDNNTLVLNVTAKDTEGRDYASTNGVITVTYDPASVALDSISVNGDYESLVIDEAAGVITFGYVNLAGIPAGENVATLTFTVIGEEDLHLVVNHLQANNYYINYSETAHDFGDWYTVYPATVTTDGLERRDCAYCDHYETRNVPFYGEPGQPIPGTPVPTPGTPGTPGGGTVVPGVPGTGTMVPGPGHDCSALNFSDLSVTEWYHNAVDFVIANGIMNGTGNGSTFSPYLNMTRGMMMTMLARLDGVDTSTGATWYEVGMKWAVEKGISDGTNPNADITREQLVTMLYRYAGSPAVSGNNYLAAYSDGAKVSTWAKDAMNWAVSIGIMQGKGNGTLDPQGLATRVEVAQLLMNYANK